MNSLKNVLLTTTMWHMKNSNETPMDQVEEESTVFWKTMMTAGSIIVRHDNTSKSAWAIVQKFLHDANLRFEKALEQEMTALRERLGRRDGDRQLYTELEDIVNRQQRILKDYRAKAGESSNETDRKVLAAEYEDAQKLLKVSIQALEAKNVRVRKCLRRREAGSLQGT